MCTIKKKRDFAPTFMWKLYLAKKGCVDVRLRRDELSWIALLSSSLCWELHFPESPLLYDFKLKLTKVFVRFGWYKKSSPRPTTIRFAKNFYVVTL